MIELLLNVSLKMDDLAAEMVKAELALDLPHFPDADYKHLETPNSSVSCIGDRRRNRIVKCMSKKPTSSPWNKRPVRKSGKKKVTTAAFKKRTGVRVISNDRPRKRRYFSPSSNLIVVILIASAFLFLNYMDELGIGYTDPETGFDKRAASVLRGTITTRT